MRSIRSQTRGGDVQRVFVALWPPTHTAEQLERLGRQLHALAPRARRMRGDRLHLTLAFIGALSTPRVNELGRALRSLQGSPFNWTVDHTGHFARARVVWAGGPLTAPLDAVVGEVRALLDELAIPFDRQPLVPHVTLLRGVTVWPQGNTALPAPITWRCERPVLVRSETTAEGTRYVEVVPD